MEKKRNMESTDQFCYNNIFMALQPEAPTLGAILKKFNLPVDCPTGK